MCVTKPYIYLQYKLVWVKMKSGGDDGSSSSST